ncbi:MAG: hypothetical protein F6K31_15390 [Symploca sp. SIO2G7]|nr:hypothetical protein [Symploca sp. SIO2G7]
MDKSSAIRQLTRIWYHPHSAPSVERKLTNSPFPKTKNECTSSQGKSLQAVDIKLSAVVNSNWSLVT